MLDVVSWGCHQASRCASSPNSRPPPLPELGRRGPSAPCAFPRAVSLFTELSAAKPRPCSFPLSVRQFLRLEVQSSACASLSSCQIQSVTTSHHSTAERIPSIFLATFPPSFLISPPPRPRLFSTRCSRDLIKVHTTRCHSSS